MTAPVLHRRAERFAQLLEEAAGAPRHHVRSAADEELAPLVTVGHRISKVRTTVETDPDFRSGLRAMLVATAERDGIGVTDTAPETSPRTAALARLRRGTRPTTVTARRARARAAAIVGIAAGTLALSGMSAASGDAMPGDALYGVKRSTERAQLALAGSDLSRGQLYLEFAKTRVAEARAVYQDEAGLRDVLGDMDKETRQGVKLLTTAAVQRRDPAALDAVKVFADLQRENVGALQDLPSPNQRELVNESLALLDRVQTRVAALRPTLTCDGPRGTDDLGPLAILCDAPATQTDAAPAVSTAPAGSAAPASSAAPAGSTAPASSAAPAGGDVGDVAEQDDPARADHGGSVGNTERRADHPTRPEQNGETRDDSDGGLVSHIGRFLSGLLGS